MENPEPPEQRTTRAREKAKQAAEEEQAAVEKQQAAVEKQQLIDKYQGLLMVGGKGEEDLNLTPGVHDEDRRELDEIMARKNAGLLELSPSSAAVGEESSEEEQAAVKEEVAENGEERQEFRNLLTGQGDIRVKTETGLLEEIEIKTEEQGALSEVNTSE